MDLTRFQHQLKGTSSKARPLPPVDQWNPDFCGDINLTIALDGRWFYEGSPIGRASLVKLFASVLKREGDKYFLVTPVEKVGITVEDTPFLITQWHMERNEGGEVSEVGQEGEADSDSAYIFATQTGDIIRLERADQLELRVPPKAIQDSQATPIPYIRVRSNLWARLHQNTYYQLLEQAEESSDGSGTRFSIRSSGTTFVLGEILQTP
ncbi:DUF1285 domain-containing protein [Alteromonas sp. BL110]|uniref:DUF1285 domain-containing protein n=1 Tax=Alteromonas sp. BL110 TaxID=1714845 RepID=UPI000E5323D6|nr:DUF1285 domain-containing protein [Alteromonas sp. BL110]AXT38580.1 DUF1285 domain-containing protein [Alteromonas sp. BL110]RKM83270.1 DUF1285 domain-containing protein [Alteromonas sp. BL110]